MVKEVKIKILLSKTYENENNFIDFYSWKSNQSCFIDKKIFYISRVFTNDYLDNSFAGFHTVDYVDHTECSCQCKRKASDCKGNHKYNPVSCLCDCPPSAKTTCSDKKQVRIFF